MHTAAHGLITDGGSVDLGTAMHDNATLGGTQPFAPTGNVTFSITGPGGTAALANAAPEGGFYRTSASTGALVAGNYFFSAAFAGDDNYNPISAGDHNPERFTVRKGDLTLTTTMHKAPHVEVPNNVFPASPESVPFGTVMHDNATLSGPMPFTPTGAVTFTLTGPGGPIATSTLPTPESPFYATSSDSGVLVTPGDYTYDASFAGDDNYNSILADDVDDEHFSVSKGREGRDYFLTTEVHDPQHNDFTFGILPYGTAVHDKAIFDYGLPAYPKATGEVTFTLYKENGLEP
jgi:hypothetical protein